MTSRVTANGLDFAYLEQGSGPLVLFVHGFPDTAHTWDGAMRAAADAGFRAVAPFTRGYHPTAIPADGAGSCGTRCCPPSSTCDSPFRSAPPAAVTPAFVTLRRRRPPAD